MGAPVGPTGCEGTAPARSVWFVGGAGAATGSTLNFTGDRKIDIQQYAVSATVGRVRPSRLSFRASLGAILGGSLEGQGRTHTIGPGVVGSIGVSQQWIAQAWFVTASAGFSASRATTTEDVPGAPTEAIIATDFRGGVMAGRRFGPVSPYVLARGFAGPVSWTLDAMDVGGSDTHFFQLGAGASVSTSSGLTLVVDVSALGEQSASLGVSFRL